MKLAKSTLLAKVNALLAFVALILFIVAFSTNYWLQQDFDFPVNYVGIETIPVEVCIGLFTACRVEHYPNNKSSSDCSPDGAADWQFISAGLCVAALVLAVIGLTLAILTIVVSKLAKNLRVKLATVFCWFLTCSFSVGPLIMFSMNRKIIVRPNTSTFQVDFDLSWSYIIAGVGSVLFALLVLLNLADIIWSHNSDENENKKEEDKYALAQDLNNVSWRT
jgi:TRAP-type C4-dicarboxylate transport system permease small subunit